MLAILLIVLTLALLVTAVLGCLLETRRLSRGDGSDSDPGHIFLRQDNKSKESEDKDKQRISRGLLQAPKLMDVPQNRVSVPSRLVDVEAAACFPASSPLLIFGANSQGR